MVADDPIAVEVKLKNGLPALPYSIGGTVHVVLSPSRRVIASPLVIGVTRLGEATSNLSSDGERTCSQLLWSADGFEAALLAAGEATLSVQSDCDLTGVVFWLTPSLQNYMSVVEPPGPSIFHAGEARTSRSVSMFPQARSAAQLSQALFTPEAEQGRAARILCLARSTCARRRARRRSSERSCRASPSTEPTTKPVRWRRAKS